MHFHTTNAIGKQGNRASRLSFGVTKSALGKSLTQSEQGDPRRGAQTSAKVGDAVSDHISNTGFCAIRLHLLSTHPLWWSPLSSHLTPLESKTNEDGGASHCEELECVQLLSSASMTHPLSKCPFETWP